MRKIKTALSLDQSVNGSGYVRGLIDGSSPLKIDSFHINPKFRGKVGKQLKDFDRQLIPRLHDVDIIFYEEPILPRPPIANIKTLLPLYAIAGHIELIAENLGIPCMRVHNGKHKSVIYGKGGPKPLNTTEHARSWGFECTNSDEADAAGVWLYSIKEWFPQYFSHWVKIKSESQMVPFLSKPKKKKPVL